jgi:hypothetical protein
MEIINGIILHEDADGDAFDLTYPKNGNHITLGNPFDNFVDIPKEDVKTLINYLQNWVNTGDFEGTKEAESND